MHYCGRSYPPPPPPWQVHCDVTHLKDDVPVAGEVLGPLRDFHAGVLSAARAHGSGVIA